MGGKLFSLLLKQKKIKNLTDELMWKAMKGCHDPVAVNFSRGVKGGLMRRRSALNRRGGVIELRKQVRPSVLLP